MACFVLFFHSLLLPLDCISLLVERAAIRTPRSCANRRNFARTGRLGAVPTGLHPNYCKALTRSGTWSRNRASRGSRTRRRPSRRWPCPSSLPSSRESCVTIGLFAEEHDGRAQGTHAGGHLADGRAADATHRDEDDGPRPVHQGAPSLAGPGSGDRGGPCLTMLATLVL